MFSILLDNILQDSNVSTTPHKDISENLQHVSKGSTNTYCLLLHLEIFHTRESYHK